MNYSKRTLSVLFLLLSLFPVSSGAEGFLILLRGDSAKSANHLHEVLSGASVETHLTIKTLLLDSASGLRLSCDSKLSECTLNNSGFEQTLSNDFDQLMLLQGAAARTLFDSISSSEKTKDRLYLHLGFSGRYGSDILNCKLDREEEKCELIRTYCYFPGC